MPGTGSRVVNGYGATAGVAFVSLVSRSDLPELGGPRNTTCPAPCRGILCVPWAAFLGAVLACSIWSVSSEIFVLRSAWTFSLALCLGRSTHISLSAASLSSGVWAFLYLASASWYCGGG